VTDIQLDKIIVANRVLAKLLDSKNRSTFGDDMDKSMMSHDVE